MAEATTKKLTKREFDAAANRLYADLERPLGTPISFGQQTTGTQRDYFVMEKTFEVAGQKVFGLPMTLKGRIGLDKDRSRIYLYAVMFFNDEPHPRMVEHARLYGSYDAYLGKWTLTWT